MLSELLLNNVKNSDTEVFVITGDLSEKRRRENMENIQSCIENNKSFCLFSTGALVGEGFDIPILDTLFLTMPISFKGRIIQYTGRLHREYEEKDEIQIYDYVDVTSRLTIDMYKRRLAAYRKMHYEIVILSGSKINTWI